MIRIGFCRPGASWLARQIAAIDAPGLYCHAGVWFDDTTLVEAHVAFGVRFRSYAPGPEWEFVDVPLNAADTARVRRWCELQAGCDYDGIGAIKHVIGFVSQDPDAWYCSELAHAALSVAGFFPGESHEVTPNALYQAMQGVVYLEPFDLPPVVATVVAAIPAVGP